MPENALASEGPPQSPDLKLSLQDSQEKGPQDQDNGMGMEQQEGMDPLAATNMLVTALISALVAKGAVTPEEIQTAMGEVVMGAGEDEQGQDVESPLAGGPSGMSKEDGSGYPGAADAGGQMGQGPTSGGGPGQ